ncbi:MAG: CoB--CoM heterodisulfide reductase iron-sulfur subunit A family protein [Desulfobacteraceae bacterium]
MTKTRKTPGPHTDPAKVGVYICYCGGNISDHVDVEAVRDRVARLPGVAAARTNMFMCSDPGQEMIMEDVKNGVVNRVVVASCAPSLHETTFRQTLIRAGVNPYIYEHANIREHVSWVHHGEKATEKATHLVAAAAAKAERLKPLEPIRVGATPHATVIGGGVAGLKAAGDLADRGFRVTLIEKTPFLGGAVAGLDTLAPTGEKAADLITHLAKRVMADPAVTLHTCSQVLGFEGYVGNFKLRVARTPPGSSALRTDGPRVDPQTLTPGTFIPFMGMYPVAVPAATFAFTIDTGVIIMATGFNSYAPRPDEYGYDRLAQVITLPDLIRILGRLPSSGRRLRVNNREIRSIAMIHCVGSRQIPGIHPEEESGYLNAYCSRTCCTAMLNAAHTIRKTFAETRVYEFYRDIRTYGRGQEELYNRAARSGVVFIRFEAEAAPRVTANAGAGDFPLLVTAADTLTFGEAVQVPVDLVVLATGMEPADVGALVEMMKLPVGNDRFLLEVHPKLRPVELPQAGIFLAGTCQAPMDTGEACNAAGAAAVKAAALLGRGYVELDPFVAEVDPAKCTGEGQCVAACLVEGALEMVDLEENGQTVRRARVAPALCTGCGACVAVCDRNAIDINGWTLAQYEAMVDQIVAAA